MKRILIIDHDLSGMHVERLLRAEGWDVYSASTGIDGLRLAAHVCPTVAIIDVALPDISGFEVLQRMRSAHESVAYLMTTSLASCQLAVASLRIGAVNCLEKPVPDRELLDAINEPVLSLSPRGANREVTEAHSVKRWAHVVVRAIDSPSDVKTLPEWGRFVGLSTSALRNWCHTARLPARDSLLFARLLRAVIRQDGQVCAPEDLLNIIDCRTMARVLTLAGSPKRGSLPVTVEDFLRNQRFIRRPDALKEIRSTLWASDRRITRPDGRHQAPTSPSL